LSPDQLEWVAAKVTEFKGQLKKLVTEEQLERKCIELNFDDEKFDAWVKDLLP